LGLRHGGCDRRARVARKHRRGATEVEWLLGRSPRETLPVMDLRRQRPIGRRIADFACPARKQVIEPDGSAHAEREGADAICAAGACALWLSRHPVLVSRYYRQHRWRLETVRQAPGAFLASPQRSAPKGPKGRRGCRVGLGTFGQNASMVGSKPSPPASPASPQRPAGATAARSTGSGCAFSLGDDRQARRGTRAPRDSRRA
jgi:uncharacterized protein DUF559